MRERVWVWGGSFRTKVFFGTQAVAWAGSALIGLGYLHRIPVLLGLGAGLTTLAGIVWGWYERKHQREGDQ